MNIKFFNQPKDVSLESLLNTKLKGDFKKIWIIAGMTKDSGMDMVFDSIEIARKNGAEVNIMIGIDRKNTSKDIIYLFILIEKIKKLRLVFTFLKMKMENLLYMSHVASFQRADFQVIIA